MPRHVCANLVRIRNGSLGGKVHMETSMRLPVCYGWGTFVLKGPYFGAISGDSDRVSVDLK